MGESGAFFYLQLDVSKYLSIKVSNPSPLPESEIIHRESHLVALHFRLF